LRGIGGSPGGGASALSSKRSLPLAQRAFLRDDATHACNARANRHKRNHAALRFHSPVRQHDEVILAVKPVTFHYKHEATNTPSFGLIAEEVAEVNPDLTVRDENGEIHAVRYDAVNAMLLNEFLKEHHKVEEQARKVQEQEATIAELKKDLRATVAHLTARLEEQAAQIQKVSAQLQVTKAAPQTVSNK
jgi:hypothetical protein